MGENVSWLVSVPCNDGNFKSHLKAASADEIKTALEAVQRQYGVDGQKGKQLALARELRKRGNNERKKG